jgi:hypothetical protein
MAANTEPFEKLNLPRVVPFEAATQEDRRRCKNKILFCWKQTASIVKQTAKHFAAFALYRTTSFVIIESGPFIFLTADVLWFF